MILTKNKTEQHKEICEKLNEIYKKKNKDFFRNTIIYIFSIRTIATKAY